MTVTQLNSNLNLTVRTIFITLMLTGISLVLLSALIDNPWFLIIPVAVSAVILLGLQSNFKLFRDDVVFRLQVIIATATVLFASLLGIAIKSPLGSLGLWLIFQGGALLISYFLMLRGVVNK